MESDKSLELPGDKSLLNNYKWAVIAFHDSDDELLIADYPPSHMTSPGSVRPRITLVTGGVSNWILGSDECNLESRYDDDVTGLSGTMDFDISPESRYPCHVTREI